MMRLATHRHAAALLRPGVRAQQLSMVALAQLEAEEVGGSSSGSSSGHVASTAFARSRPSASAEIAMRSTPSTSFASGLSRSDLADAAQRRKRAVGTLSQTPLLDARVQELVPGINQYGMHANRPLLFGGVRPREGALLMNSNDYLQLQLHPTVAAAKAEALLQTASTPSGRRNFAPDAPGYHRAFEQRMASLLGAEDAVLTMSGAHAVRGLLETLCGEHTPIYADARSWAAGASRGHGLAAAAARVTPFAHNDVHALARLAMRQPGVIVVDGVYGHGGVADLAGVCDVAEATRSVLVVDETHSFGCAAGGLGACEEAGVGDRVHFRALGLSKAFASRGGIVVGPARALEALRFVDRGLIFSTAPLEHEVVGYDATLDVLLSADGAARRSALHATHHHLREGLLALGYADDIVRSERQILAVVTGDAARTTALRDFAARRGVFGAVFLPPAAREGRSYIRFSVHAGMGAAESAHFLSVMREARSFFGFGRLGPGVV